jgi:hypothetical protein
MRIETATTVYEVPISVESEGRVAIRAWVVAHLPPEDAATVLGEAVAAPVASPVDPTNDGEG